MRCLYHTTEPFVAPVRRGLCPRCKVSAKSRSGDYCRECWKAIYYARVPARCLDCKGPRPRKRGQRYCLDCSSVRLAKSKAASMERHLAKHPDYFQRYYARKKAEKRAAKVA